jgi:hypothetical protein
MSPERRLHDVGGPAAGPGSCVAAASQQRAFAVRTGVIARRADSHYSRQPADGPDPNRFEGDHMRKPLAAAATACLLSLGAASPAIAAPPQQQGLVNVNLSDVSVQVPIAIAANVCDVNVAVLVNELQDGAAPCDADADSGATAITTTDGDAPALQNGLVNVNVTDIQVQVPIALAANVCDVNVAVLVADLQDDAATCDAAGDAVARVTR